VTVVRAWARVRDRARRELLRQCLQPVPRDDLIRLGSGYGGWWIPSSVLRPGAVAYCAGAGEDITFDLELHQRGMNVSTFDPTPRAIAHVAATAPVDSRFRFEPIGWWDSVDELRFYAPRDEAHVSHSAVNLQGTDSFFTAPVASVRNLMDRLGDEHVDLVKMDIEGAEARVINCLVEEGPRPSALCVEFDQPQPARAVLATVRALQGVGYVLNRIENWNYTFTLATAG
jgi:FkbM family methyltransferase